MNITHGRHRTTGRFFRRGTGSPHRPAASATLRARSGNQPRRRLRRSARARSPRHRRRPPRRAQRPVAAAREAETAAASGFALALAARMTSWRGVSTAIGNSYDARARNDERAVSVTSGRHVLWIAEDLSLAENGAPYGPGLDGIGIAPERLITVAAARERDVRGAMEEARTCRAVGMVIGEMRARDIDQVATRRLALAAAAGNALGLILRTAPDDGPSAAATRWIVGAAPFPRSGDGDGERHGAGP